MKLISHRGNLHGPNPERENHPLYILEALAMGYDCEIDVWYDLNKWWLGHDEPQYAVPSGFLAIEGLWVHCKNLRSLKPLYDYRDANGADLCTWFFHEKDTAALTSNQWVWTCSMRQPDTRFVLMIPNQPWYDFSSLKLQEWYGVCNDWIDNNALVDASDWVAS